MHKLIGNRIKECRERKGIKRPEFAQKLGVEPNTLYRYENGSIGVKDEIKQKIAELLGVSISYLMGEDPHPKAKPALVIELEPTIPPQLYLPVLNQEACAGQGFNWDDIEADVAEWMPWPTLETSGPNSPHRPYFVRVEGDSMIGANIDDGCLILINPNIEVRSGDIAYVRWNSRCSVKGIIFYKDGKIELRPANPNYKSTWIDKDEIENLFIMGKVVRWVNVGVPKSVI